MVVISDAIGSKKNTARILKNGTQLNIAISEGGSQVSHGPDQVEVNGYLTAQYRTELRQKKDQ